MSLLRKYRIDVVMEKAMQRMRTCSFNNARIPASVNELLHFKFQVRSRNDDFLENVSTSSVPAKGLTLFHCLCRGLSLKGLRTGRLVCF